ncbi:MAG: ribonuclease Z [Candidatus Methanoperedens sp.]|nr:ribonuclease Z [Candidatus Methanoperedens sp.]MCZ7358564.1 ribonuclease Z [Candidatus Methanoperedens sp.]HLB70016.1 ribonuclease Z [Candidatus Methanoperedens sp.]
MLRVTFLGTGGTLPTPRRNPSAVLINRDGELMLFDCGEGTQQQMMRAKTGMKLTSIFITHFHADHFLGIPGLIQTLSFNGRTEPLEIYGPEWTEQLVTLLIELGYYKLGFEILAHELKDGDVVNREEYSITAAATDHGIPSLGYVLEEKKRTGRFNRERAIELGIPVGPLFSKLQKGEPVRLGDRIINPSDVIGQDRPGRKLVYSGDTRPCRSIENASAGADLLIHDGTLGDELKDWAVETKHSTSKEAALLAQKAKVKQLVLTHISSRYSESADPLLLEARSIFEKVKIAEEFMEIDIQLSDK